MYSIIRSTSIALILTLIFTAGLTTKTAQANNPEPQEQIHEKTSIEFTFEANSISELDEVELNKLNNLKLDNKEAEVCEATVTVTVSVGVASVSLSATASCDEIAETANRLIDQAKSIVSEQL